MPKSGVRRRCGSPKVRWSAALQRALSARPGNPDAQAYFGLALARLGKRDEAVRALRTALQQKPDHAQARAWLEAVEQMPPK